MVRVSNKARGREGMAATYAVLWLEELLVTM